MNHRRVYDYLESSTMAIVYRRTGHAYKANYMLSNRTRATRQLKKTHELSCEKSIQSLYQAKLMALAGEF